MAGVSKRIENLHKGIRQRLKKHIEATYPIDSRWTRLVVTGYVQNGLTWSPVCKCDCGNEKVIKWPNRLRNKRIESCGCLGREVRFQNGVNHKGYRTLAPGVAALNIVFINYKNNARRKSLSFSLTKDQFRALTQHCCNYCGSPPLNVVSTPSGNYTYSGLDRVDNSQGYELDNVAPCCKMCQYAKRNWTLSDFLGWAKRLADHQLKPQQRGGEVLDRI
jgi:hypothetical protein